MDLFEIIRKLHEERKRVDRIIQRLQELHEPEPPVKKRRGRPPAARPPRNRPR